MINSTAARITQLGYLVIGVTDPAAWSTFMTAGLGLQANGVSADGTSFFRMDAHHHRFIIAPTGEDDLVTVGWQVRDAAALREIADRLVARGIVVEEGTAEFAAARKVLGLIRFTAPDGLATEVYFGPLVDHRPFVSPRGVSGFRADGLGLGHIVLTSYDIDVDLAFFTDVLGFRVSDWIRSTVPPVGRRGVFTHVNPRHHSLALGMPADPDKPQKRLNHFMVETMSLADVGHAVDVFTESGVLAGPLSCHTNDHMVSCYARTPSGFTVEYGWNGRAIDDDPAWPVQFYGASRQWGAAKPKA